MNKEHTLIRLVDDDESLLFSTKILLEVLGWKVAAYIIILRRSFWSATTSVFPAAPY